MDADLMDTGTHGHSAGRFDGKVAVVVGGATGIGAATAGRLAREGARVVVGDIDLEAAERTAAAIVRSGAAAIAVRVDVADDDSVAGVFDRAMAEYGRVDAVHSNAADTRPATVGRDSNVVDIDLELWDHVIAVALRGFALCCRHAVPVLLAGGGGSIVATSSDGAFKGLPVLPAYTAAKAGLNEVVRHVATAWGRDGLRCNAVSPGRVETGKPSASVMSQDYYLDEVRSPRLGVPDDVAGAVAYLLSDEAEWVNGQVLSVNGGALMR
jgi:NAD(P)-dependent dehydrogenase (short-subunit alcohol dehydrogenase family)